jgi:NitT/TauT family transport system substrate-binding protein
VNGPSTIAPTRRSTTLRTTLRLLAGLALALTIAAPAPASAEVTELRISRQPGLAYLPLMVIEEDKLVEKEAKKRGVDLRVDWIKLNGGGASVDTLLSGNVDLVTSGATNLLLLWDKTHGQVKGVVAAAAVPMRLLTRNPSIKTLKDFGPSDKIAVPTIKVSTQAMVLQMAAAKAFGENDAHKLDQYTVSLGHPDAMIGLTSGKDPDTHFSISPYQEQELKTAGVHEVTNSLAVLGGPATNGVVFATAKFHDANPKVIAVFLAAMDDALATINKDKRRAAELYLRDTNEKNISADDLAKWMSDPNFVFSGTPRATMKFADLMHRFGEIKTMPASWKDYFFADIHGMPGS